MNRINGVSIIIDGERLDLPAPNRHHNIYRKITEVQRTIANDATIEEGFYDDEGYFLDRRTALIRSKETGQFNRRRNPNDYDGPELFSEDLW